MSETFNANRPLTADDDPYRILGIPRDAGLDLIRTAFRKKAAWTHSDVTKSTDEEAVKAVNRAFTLLKDPEKRAAYDRGDINIMGHRVSRAPEARPAPPHDPSPYSEEGQKERDEMDLKQEVNRLFIEHTAMRKRKGFEPAPGMKLYEQEDACQEIFAYFMRTVDVVEALDRKTQKSEIRTGIDMLRIAVVADLEVFVNRVGYFTERLAGRDFGQALDFTERLIMKTAVGSGPARVRLGNAEDRIRNHLSSVIRFEKNPERRAAIRRAIAQRIQHVTRLSAMYAFLAQEAARDIDTGG